MTLHVLNGRIGYKQNRLSESHFQAEKGLCLTTNAQGLIAPFQRWYKFKEAFAPSLVIEQINDLPSPPSLIVDTFGGSGTTALISSYLGIKCHTIEVNPFLADLIKAKTSDHDPHSILLSYTEVIAKAALDRGRSIDKYKSTLPPTFIEESEKERWIYNADIASRILAYRAAIDGLSHEGNARLLRILLGSCLVEVSNVRINGKGRRYRSGWQNRLVSVDDLDSMFQEKVSAAVEDISNFSRYSRVQPCVTHGDSRQKASELPSDIDLAIFSPPYPNSFDYTDIYNLELWMLGYLKAGADNRELREATLRSHVQIKRDFKDAPSGSPLLSETLKRLTQVRAALWSKYIPEMVGAYFTDMLVIIESIAQKLSQEGRIVMVVGDSSYAGIHVPVANILAELSESIGLKVKSLEAARSMRASPQQGGNLVLPETLITLGAQ